MEDAMNDFPEPSDEELAEYSIWWQLTEQIDDFNLEIARVNSIASVSQADDLQKRERVTSLELERDNLKAQLSAHYSGPINAQAQSAAGAPQEDATTTGAKLPNAVPALVEPALPGPQPVPTRDMAASFAGLHWDGNQWLKKLGNKPRWLDACLVLGAARGEGMRRWNPVLIGGYLVNMGHVRVNSVRAKFQSQDALKPWLDEWKTYEADNFTTQ